MKPILNITSILLLLACSSSYATEPKGSSGVDDKAPIKQLSEVCVIPESGAFTVHSQNGKTFLIFRALSCTSQDLTWFVDIQDLKKEYDKSNKTDKAI
jgi:hypothetical protein